MTKCQCLTVKGKQCNKSASVGNLYCHIHKDCKASLVSQPPKTTTKIPIISKKYTENPYYKKKTNSMALEFIKI